MTDSTTTCGPDYPYPVFLNLSGRRCLVVGGGPVALRKARDLAEAGAAVTIVAESFITAFQSFAADFPVEMRERRFEPDDVDGVLLVFAATDDGAVNKTIARTARERGVLVNAVDDPDLCDFYSGAIVKRGPLRIAISTSGCSPACAARIREELERHYGVEWGAYLTLIGSIRRNIVSSEQIQEERKREALAWLGSPEAFAMFVDEGEKRVWDSVQRIISS